MQPQSEPARGNLSRRGFLRLGLGGTAFLTGVSLTATLSGCATSPAQPAPGRTGAKPYRFLSRDDLVFLGATVPVMLGPALPTDPQARQASVEGTIRRMDEAIYRFGPTNQAQMRKLFDMLNFSLTRITLAGVWSSWDNASPDSIDSFLNRWRNSSIGLFNKAYAGLVKLTNSSFYGYRDNWHLSGYPGPQSYVTNSLPQFQTPSSTD